LVKKYAVKVRDSAQEVAEKTDVEGEDEKVKQAGRDLKTFVERLAGKSLDPLIEKAQKVSVRAGLAGSASGEC
jgi:ribosomal protein L12E/L44/L45/RPP1/RPP2